jgi:signal transduction histidine kinase
MDKLRHGPRRGWFGLSARLLLLTIFFVMLSEVFIYAPSIGRFRVTYLQERIAAAHLASLALDATPNNMVSDRLRSALLDHAGVHGIMLKRPSSKALILSKNMPPAVDKSYDLEKGRFFGLIGDAFETMLITRDRALRIMARSPKDPAVTVEIVLSERPMREAMVQHSLNILALSVAISLITAVLVFLSLRWLFVRPMRQITAAMVRFREDPADGTRLVTPDLRTDELGVARRELAGMQRGLRAALLQHARLAALGTAVTKINHDLRNILASAQLVSDHLETTEDPKIKRIAPTLMGAIDRAVELCSKTLNFVQEGAAAFEVRAFPLAPLLDELANSAAGIGDGKSVIDSRVDALLELHADRGQLFRVFLNLVRNAFEAGAGRVAIRAEAEAGHVIIEVSDNGPGLPEIIRNNLFQPFQGTTRVGGTGLGLSIARDLMRGHGGDIELLRTGSDGTVFRLILPVDLSHGGEQHVPKLVHG